MKKIIKPMLSAAIFLNTIFSLSYCEELKIDEIIDEFQAGTDVQRSQLIERLRDKRVFTKGVVKDADEFAFFDKTAEKESQYYKVITELAKTGKGNSYAVVYIYTNLDRVKNINKGDRIDRYDRFLAMSGGGMWVTAWFYGDGLDRANAEEIYGQWD